MVISPKELIRTEEEKIVVGDLETRIDAFLINNYDGNGIVKVPVGKAPKLIRRIILNDMLESYRDSGWTHVKYVEGECGHIEFGYAYSKFAGSYYDYLEQKKDTEDMAAKTDERMVA